jgi:hypothetical protein
MFIVLHDQMQKIGYNVEKRIGATWDHDLNTKLEPGHLAFTEIQS